MNARAYKLEVYVLDYIGICDKHGTLDISHIIENAHDDLGIKVIDIKWKNVGEWSDSHLLNKTDTWKQTYLDLFKE